MRRRKIKKALSHLLFMLATGPLLVITILVYLINWLMLFQSTRAKRGRIRIASREKEDRNFVALTLEALALIEKQDARRYARLQKELLFITDDPSTAYACYYRRFRKCEINWGHSSFDWAKGDMPAVVPHYAWYLAYYACTIVHEATHGRLHSLGFSYTKQTRVRIERMCEAEARRFAARLPQTEYNFASDLISPFDPTRWEAHWNMTLMQQLRASLGRIRRRRKERNRASDVKATTEDRVTVPPLGGVGSGAKNRPMQSKEPYSIWPKPSASDDLESNKPTVPLPDWAAPFVRVHPRKKKVK